MRPVHWEDVFESSYRLGALHGNCRSSGYRRLLVFPAAGIRMKPSFDFKVQRRIAYRAAALRAMNS